MLQSPSNYVRMIVDRNKHENNTLFVGAGPPNDTEFPGIMSICQFIYIMRLDFK